MLIQEMLKLPQTGIVHSKNTSKLVMPEHDHHTTRHTSYDIAIEIFQNTTKIIRIASSCLWSQCSIVWYSNTPTKMLPLSRGAGLCQCPAEVLPGQQWDRTFNKPGSTHDLHANRMLLGCRMGSCAGLQLTIVQFPILTNTWTRSDKQAIHQNTYPSQFWVAGLTHNFQRKALRPDLAQMSLCINI